MSFAFGTFLRSPRGALSPWAFALAMVLTLAASEGSAQQIITGGGTIVGGGVLLGGGGGDQCVADGGCDDGNECTFDRCELIPPALIGGGGVNVCRNTPLAAGTPCGSDVSNGCTAPDTCNGSGVCSANDQLDGASCDDGIFCTAIDTCQGGVCTGGGNPCAGADGDGDCQESCNENLGACNASDANGSFCDDGLFCNGQDSCQRGICTPSGDPCVGADGDGDCSESCDEKRDSCTANDPDDSICNDGLFCTASDTCQAGTCTGAGDPCSGADGDLDCSESCNEGADSCTGLDPDGTLCRASTGDCDAEETCSAGACPADGFQPRGTVCRGASDVCDRAEACTGLSATCPSDVLKRAGEVCRPSSGDCDVAEACTGDAAACPSDGFLPVGTSCRAAAGDCDVAEVCPGDAAACPSDVLLPVGTSCRAAVGDCDVAESCSGADAACPADVIVEDDEPCDDGDSCTSGTLCASGVCGGGAVTDCSDGNLCTVDSCDPIEGCMNDDTLSLGGCLDGFERGVLLVNEKKVGKEKLVVSLLKGPELTQVGFGDPLVPGGDAYALCLYDGAGDLIHAAEVDRAGEQCSSRDCWKAVGKSPPDGKGYLYKDSAGSAAGTNLIKLRGGAAGKSSVQFKARNNDKKNQLSLPGGIAAALAGSTTATAQVVSDSGLCLSRTFTDVTSTTPELFRAK